MTPVFRAPLGLLCAIALSTATFTACDSDVGNGGGTPALTDGGGGNGGGTGDGAGGTDPDVPGPDPDAPGPDPDVPGPDPDVPGPDPDVPDPDVPEPDTPEPQCSCDGKVCGDDGCGNSCGECAEGWVCTLEGLCLDCTCGGAECGPSACGTNCGTCGEGLICDAGQCVDDGCECGAKQCGDDGCGNSCGTCAAGEVCSSGICILPSTPNGQWCGTTEGCTLESPAFPGCMHSQCDSGFCLQAGAPGVFVTHPTCSQPCTIVKDSVNNATGAAGGDGIEDPDTPDSACWDFSDGPAGDSYVCASFGGGGSFCAPGSTFEMCLDDSDCPSGEGCFVTTLGGVLAQRCMALVQGGEWGTAVPNGAPCDELTADDPQYCASGLCLGLGCASLCDDDSACGAGSCEGPFQLFSSVPDFTAKVCFPGGCETQKDCQEGAYCRYSWNGEPYPEAAWDNLCLPQLEGGQALGEPCDDEAGLLCANTDLCLGGFCSALCASDAECNTGAGQKCVWSDFTGDFDGDGLVDFALATGICEVFEGAGASCLSQAGCGAGKRCKLYTVAQPEDPDAPYVMAGTCVDAEGAGEFGAPCLSGSECAGGLCVGADALTGEPGYCSMACASADECPATVMDIDGSPTAVAGGCWSTLNSWGGDFGDLYVNTYVPICQPLPNSSGNDCSADLTCPAGEACWPFSIVTSADKAAKIEYRCLALVDPEEPPGTAQVGDFCDPEAETNACAEGFCLTNEPGIGYCSSTCSQANDLCAGSDNPDLTCLDYTGYPWGGVYAGNSATYSLCIEDVDCDVCAYTEQCPGDRVCADLGGGDFRCVPSCDTSTDCAGQASGTCSTGSDPSGKSVSGCFSPGVNYCN